MKKTIFAIAASSLCLALFTYIALSMLVIYKTSTLNDYCKSGVYARADNTTERFYRTYKMHRESIDLSRWWFQSSSTESIPSSTPGVQLKATLTEAKGAHQWIIVVHGIETCRLDSEVLVPASMLLQSGFSVLMLDLREHGESTRTTGRHTGGYYERQDILAAWKWLQTHQGVDAKNIGIYGLSFGAGSTALAFGLEPNVQAVWLDAPYANMQVIIGSELKRLGLPSWMAGFVVHVWKQFRGIDLEALAPIDSMQRIGSRALAVSYNLNDARTPASHGKSLCEAAKQHAVHPSRILCYPHEQGVMVTPTQRMDYHVVGPLTESTWQQTISQFFKKHLG